MLLYAHCVASLYYFFIFSYSVFFSWILAEIQRRMFWGRFLVWAPRIFHAWQDSGNKDVFTPVCYVCIYILGKIEFWHFMLESRKKYSQFKNIHTIFVYGIFWCMKYTRCSDQKSTPKHLSFFSANIHEKKMKYGKILEDSFLNLLPATNWYHTPLEKDKAPSSQKIVCCLSYFQAIPGRKKNNFLAKKLRL